MAYDLKDPFWITLNQWQTLVAGALAALAGAAAVWATILAAGREIAAARDQTAAAHEQTKVIQILERRRIAAQSYAFFAMCDAALAAVLDDVNAARELISGGLHGSESNAAYAARRRVKKVGFPEIRNACVSFGGRLTAPLLRLDKEIDDYAAQIIEWPDGTHLPMGKHEGLFNQLAKLEAQANYLRSEAGKGMQQCMDVLGATPVPDATGSF